MNEELSHLKSDAHTIASTCLAEAWDITEKKLISTLPKWQKVMMDDNILISAETEEEVAQLLPLILNAMKKKDAVLLSNALTDLAEII